MILCQMVWPDFCLGKSGQEGEAEALGPGMAARWAEDSWRSACPGYYRGPQRSEQEEKPDLKETKGRQGTLGLRCLVRGGGTGTQGGEAHGKR